MRSTMIVLTAAAFTAAAAFSPAFAQSGGAEGAHQSLKAPADFASIGDKAARSRAMFSEIGKLLTHPQCMNCHPAGEHPLQGADHHDHQPPAWRDATNCAACHHDANFTLQEAASYKSIPGHPRWNLAPLSMAWQGKSLGRHLPADQGQGSERRPRPRDVAGAHCQGRSGGVGLESRTRP